MTISTLRVTWIESNSTPSAGSCCPLRREPIAEEIRRGIKTGEIDPAVDVEAMIDLINGLYYYQFVVRAPSDPDQARARVRAAVQLVFDGARPA